MTIFDPQLTALLQNMQRQSGADGAADPGKVLRDTLKRAALVMALQNAARIAARTASVDA